MEQTKLMDAHVQVRRVYNLLGEVMDLSRQLAEAVDRNDQVSIQMLLAMREEPIQGILQAREAMQQQMNQMAVLIAKLTGDTRLVDATSQEIAPVQGVPSGEVKEKNVDDFGNIAKEGMNSTAGKARAKAAAAATPKV